LNRVRRSIGVPIGLSIGKSRHVPAEDQSAVVSDYVEAWQCVRNAADFVVVNISSPNTAGLRQMQMADRARELLGTLIERGADPGRLLLKVAPDLDEGPLDELLSAVDSARIAGVVATNTTTARTGLVTSPERVQSIGDGGLSGPPLRERALHVVRHVRRRLGRTSVVIGVGGVESGEHALDLLAAGANLVQMYTGLVFQGPAAPGRIARELIATVDRSRFADLGSLARERETSTNRVTLSSEAPNEAQQRAISTLR
jgi:dihydroorotate dehydrogenase